MDFEYQKCVQKIYKVARKKTYTVNSRKYVLTLRIQ